jgi:RNA polymerase sigma factor (sigma-70 family)
MNVHISYRLHKTPAVEQEIHHQIERLRKRLQVFRPELVHLKGMVEEFSTREGFCVTLNLRLPSGQMAVEEKAATATTAVKSAFEDLLHQVNQHKELLRATHKWPRRQKDSSAKRNASIPFEQTLAAVFPAAVSADDVRSYVNVNLARLERYVEREIYFREASGLIEDGSIIPNEVIDETIAAALGDGQEKPERLALETWLYGLAKRALDELSRADELARADGSNGSAIHRSAIQLEARERERELQFQPEEAITEEIIADTRMATPEQIVGSDEMMRLIAEALHDISPAQREAFILHAMEGFGVDEISAITGIAPENISNSIAAAREHLRKSPGIARQFRGRFRSVGTA